MNGTPIYARLSRLLAMLPARTDEIAADLGVTQRAVGVWLRYMRAEGLIGYGELRQRQGRVIVLGNGARFDSSGFPVSAAAQQFCRAWHLLRTRQTTDSLAEALGVHRRTAGNITQKLREDGHIRVCGWELRGQTYAPVFDRLPAPDVPRPGREPRSDVNARHWARRRERMSEGRAAE